MTKIEHTYAFLSYFEGERPGDVGSDFGLSDDHFDCSISVIRDDWVSIL